MARALVTLLEDRALTQKYGARARATVEQRYTLDHVLNMYIAIYERLTSGQKSPSAIAELQETAF
jgi:glycosyltransferase involved in cell wall biosynthesis